MDVHAHLTDEKFDDLTEVLNRAKEVGVETVISAGYDFLSSQNALKLAKTLPNIYATAGIHPENIADFDNFGILALKNAKENFEKEFEKISALAKEEKIVAIGEIGLDYHFIDWLNKENQQKFGKSLSEKEIEGIKSLQKMAFEKQVQLAQSVGKPVVVHSRDAMGDTIEVLQRNPLKRESLLHCFSGSLESARILMKLGYSFSFGGVVTFKNAKNVQEVVRNIPFENILLETDCPYMSPKPFRGQRNEPKNVIYVADMIARLKNVSIDDVAQITTQNAKRLFVLR